MKWNFLFRLVLIIKMSPFLHSKRQLIMLSEMSKQICMHEIPKLKSNIVWLHVFAQIGSAETKTKAGDDENIL